MNALDALTRQLQRVFANRPPEGTDWREPQAMSAALGRVRQIFADRLAERAGPRTNRSLLAFRMAPHAIGFVDLKLACRAITRPADWGQRRLIDDDQLLTQLLDQVERLRPQPRRYQACLQALQQALAELPQNDAQPLAGNERRLQNWLAQH